MVVSYKRPSFFLRYLLMVLIAALSVMGIFAKRGWLDWQRMNKRNAELHQKIQQARFQKNELERQIRLFKSNPQEQERVVRRVLGYVRQDEKIIEFE